MCKICNRKGKILNEIMQGVYQYTYCSCDYAEQLKIEDDKKYAAFKKRLKEFKKNENLENVC